VGQLDHSSSAAGSGLSTVQRYVLSVPFVSGVAASAGVLLTAIVIVCAAYHRKSRESDRVMKRMQSQMDGLESRVAKECKEGSHLFIYDSLAPTTLNGYVCRCNVM